MLRAYGDASRSKSRQPFPARCAFTLQEHGDRRGRWTDTASGEIIAYAPIRDPDAVYSDNGYLTAQGFLDPDTLLLLVGPMNYRTMEVGEERWHLVAWHFRDGAFELISSGDTRMRGIEVAPALLD